MANEHPVESIPAYVLGVLDDAETARMAEHLAVCPECRAEAEEFRRLLQASDGPAPRPHVKRRVFERIFSFRNPNPPLGIVARPRPPLRPRIAPFLMLALMLVLMFGVVLDSRHRVEEMAARVQSTETQLADLQQRLSQAEQTTNGLQEAMQRAQQIMTFVGAPETQSLDLASETPATGAQATMYMQANHNRVVIIAHGLPATTEGWHYHVWLADGEHRILLGRLNIHDNGMAELIADAPRTVNNYAQMMITLDPPPDASASPSEVVLQTNIS